MANEDELVGSPLKEFVKSTVNQIKEALPEGFRIKEDIEFELSVVSTGNVQGGVDLRVLKLGGSKNNQEAQKIKFSVTDKEPEIDPVKEAQKNVLKKRGLI